MRFNDLATAQTAVVALIGAMKSVKGFVINNVIVCEQVAKMASSIEEGQIIQAIGAAEQVVGVGRSVLGAFIRNSVFDKKTDAGVTVGRARFLISLEQIVAEKFDTDLVNRFKKLIEELYEAIASESNGDFSRRIAAFNALHEFDGGVDAEQARRDEARDRKRRAEKAERKAMATGKPVTAPNAERTELLAARAAERKASADELRGLLA